MTDRRKTQRPRLDFSPLRLSPIKEEDEDEKFQQLRTPRRFSNFNTDLKDIILGKLKNTCSFPVFLVVFGSIIGLMFFIKALFFDGQLSFLGLYARIIYFTLQTLEVLYFHPNNQYTSRERWATAIPHITGGLLSVSQLWQGFDFGAKNYECTDFLSCL